MYFLIFFFEIRILIEYMCRKAYLKHERLKQIVCLRDVDIFA